jgi:polyferredoxin
MLRDRVTRRKMLSYWLLVVLTWIAVGMWVIDGWLADSAMRFLIWWGVCMVLTLMLILFALYDALRVLKED